MAAGKRVYLAVDLGAESGRVMAGEFDGGRLALKEIHRFGNGPRADGPRLYWDLEALGREVEAGLTQAARLYGRGAVRGLGVDTWGVDYGLLDDAGQLLGAPRAYRDERTTGLIDAACARVPRRSIYETTGIQFMPFNTLFQLMADQRDDPDRLARARRLLFMPDLIHQRLTGVAANERTIASTGQLLDARTGTWALDLIRALGLPTHLFGALAAPGTVLGPLTPALAAATGLGPVPVIAPGAHDTASAVAAVPMQPDRAAYLSSGTWSLMGIETVRPLISDRTYDYELTNEGGVGGTFRVLKNIAGLWLAQECRRAWQAAGQEYSYAEIQALAAAAEPFAAWVNPDDPAFAAPGDMPARLAANLRARGFTPPETPGGLARMIFESLAWRYRGVFAALEELAGRRLDTIHIVGGGSRNELLNQFTADVTGRPVQAGPVEATALGNVLVQMIACGDLRDIVQGREVVGASFPTSIFEPRDTARWNAKGKEWSVS